MCPVQVLVPQPDKEVFDQRWTLCDAGERGNEITIAQTSLKQIFRRGVRAKHHPSRGRIHTSGCFVKFLGQRSALPTTGTHHSLMPVFRFSFSHCILTVQGCQCGGKITVEKFGGIANAGGDDVVQDVVGFPFV